MPKNRDRQSEEKPGKDKPPLSPKQEVFINTVDGVTSAVAAVFIHIDIRPDDGTTPAV